MNLFSVLVKYVLGFFNLLLTLTGITIIVLGVYVLKFFVSLYNNTDFPDLDLTFIGVIVIALGCVVTSIAFFGCCGAFVENRCLLYVYIILVLIITIPVIIVTIFYNTQLGNLLSWTENVLDDVFSKEPQAFYGIEYTLGCCGTSGPEAYANSTLFPPGVLPPTCCITPVDNYCTNSDYSGCTGLVTDFINTYGSILSSIFIGVVTVEVIAMASALFLCFEITGRT